jgi:uncharacterized protein YbjT (DUF2867 family)
MHSRTILVTGATGNVGAELVRALAEQGEPVRALVRDADRAATLPDGVDTAVGDLNDPASVAAALEGVRAAHLLAGYGGLPETLAHMRDAGVERVTLQSGSSATASDGADNAVARYHIESEAATRDSGLTWTFLQPNSFASNTLQWRDQLAQGDTVAAPFADVAVSVIDPRDIAAVAAHALTTGDLDGRTLRLSGPEALRPADRLRILGEVLARHLTLRPQSDDEARAEMLAGMPEAYADAFLSFFVDGTIDETTVHPTVEEVLGRPPRTFRAWAEEHAGAFR